MRELLQRLAEPLKLGVGRVGPVVYLGPPPTAAVLGTVAAWKEDQDQAFPAAVRDKLRGQRRCHPAGADEAVLQAGMFVEHCTQRAQLGLIALAQRADILGAQLGQQVGVQLVVIEQAGESR